ncbi:MAG: putative DNA modification/repair radical SAM protein [Spirochaetes bacterium]|nr:MAG: putative DNA modification/repair radical SAM protein [Spirochaetota bacterium]
MDIYEKLEILSSAAKYDVSCASSGTDRKRAAGGIGTAVRSGICHSWSDDGRCISLLKVLITNKCAYNCAYCVNRASNDLPRALLTPEEIAGLTVQFYRRNYIEGLFLSSAVYRNPDYTMELILRTAALLREKYRFNGYIHAKAIPGADPALIRRTGFLVDRMSANIELPSEKSLALLAPQKAKGAIFRAMKDINGAILDYREGSRSPRPYRGFVPAGQSTQLIVGASPESDHAILCLSEALYRGFSLKRVYYSAYVPVTTADTRLPLADPPLRREHRLYQADWLLRFYGFSAGELLSEKNPNFDPDLDPKSHWALSNLHRFPVELTTADYEMILRVPGIGLRSAQRIVRLRTVRALAFDDLRKIGVVLKRARFFITCGGTHLEKGDLERGALRARIVGNHAPLLLTGARGEERSGGQLELFGPDFLRTRESGAVALTGEL